MLTSPSLCIRQVRVVRFYISLICSSSLPPSLPPLLVASSTPTICTGFICKLFNGTLQCQAHTPYFPVSMQGTTSGGFQFTSGSFYFGILSGISPDILSDVLSNIPADTLSYIFWHFFLTFFWHIFWLVFWHSFWHIFWTSQTAKYRKPTPKELQRRKDAMYVIQRAGLLPVNRKVKHKTIRSVAQTKATCGWISRKPNKKEVSRIDFTKIWSACWEPYRL